MHIGIAGPIATADIAPLLSTQQDLPRGYAGAPLLTTLITELLARGHRISAFTLSSDMPLRHDATVVARGDRLELHYVPMRPRAWPMNGWRLGRIVDLYAFERAGLTRAMEAAAPDVIHAHWAYEFAWAALASRRPHVVTCHDSPALVARMQRGYGLRRRGYRWLRAAMARHVLARAQVVTAVSPYMSSQISPWCHVQPTVIANPLAHHVLARRSTGTAARRRILMVANGFDERKNGQRGLLAFSLLASEHPGTELVACGAEFGPGEPAERWWRSCGLRGQVRFKGAVSHQQVLSEMEQADALLHPAIEESFGAVLAEALAMGLAVVAGKNSGAVPWVVGEAGVLVDVRDPDAVARSLASLLDEDDGARRRRSEAGRANVVQRFRADAVAAAYEERYGHALTLRSTARAAETRYREVSE